MNILKKHFKLVIGAFALILVVVGIFFVLGGGSLESGTMKNWTGAGLDRRMAAVRLLTGNDDNTGLMVACLDKIAELPDAAVMPVKDAAALCFMGIQLKENI